MKKRTTRAKETIEQLNKEYPQQKWQESNTKLWKPSTVGDVIVGFVQKIIEQQGKDYDRILLLYELEPNGIIWAVPYVGQLSYKLLSVEENNIIAIHFLRGHKYRIYVKEQNT